MGDTQIANNDDNNFPPELQKIRKGEIGFGANSGLFFTHRWLWAAKKGSAARSSLYFFCNLHKYFFYFISI
jgi:hypothetical protein